MVNNMLVLTVQTPQECMFYCILMVENHSKRGSKIDLKHNKLGPVIRSCSTRPNLETSCSSAKRSRLESWCVFTLSPGAFARSCCSCPCAGVKGGGIQRHCPQRADPPPHTHTLQHPYDCSSQSIVAPPRQLDASLVDLLWHQPCLVPWGSPSTDRWKLKS